MVEALGIVEVVHPVVAAISVDVRLHGCSTHRDVGHLKARTAQRPVTGNLVLFCCLFGARRQRQAATDQSKYQYNSLDLHVRLSADSLLYPGGPGKPSIESLLDLVRGRYGD